MIKWRIGIAIVCLNVFLASCSSSDSSSDEAKEVVDSPLEDLDIGSDQDPFAGLSEAEQLEDALQGEFDSGVNETDGMALDDSIGVDLGEETAGQDVFNEDSSLQGSELDGQVSSVDSEGQLEQYEALNSTDPIELAGADSSPSGFSEIESAAPRLIPVKKIKDRPYEMPGIGWINAVFIVRPGDTLQTISQKIYGSDKVSELETINPHLVSGVKPGDKVYYASAARAGDSNAMLFYPEDVGLPMESYVSRERDNIRRVSKELLGFDGAWKEIWATNLDVESKGDIPAGLVLKYYKIDAQPGSQGGQLAQQLPPSGLPKTMDPPLQALGDPSPPEPLKPNQTADAGLSSGDLGSDIEELDRESDLASNDSYSLPPPTPPPRPVAQPSYEDEYKSLPPIQSQPNSAPVANSSNGVDEEFGFEDETLFPMVGAGIVLLAIVVFVIVRRRRRLAEESYDAVQFETEDPAQKING